MYGRDLSLAPDRQPSVATVGSFAPNHEAPIVQFHIIPPAVAECRDHDDPHESDHVYNSPRLIALVRLALSIILPHQLKEAHRPRTGCLDRVRSSPLRHASVGLLQPQALPHRITSDIGWHVNQCRSTVRDRSLHLELMSVIQTLRCTRRVARGPEY